MPKTISAYGGFTSADLKARAEIPAQTDMTISGSNVDCVNIKDSDIKNVLGESVTGVGALCISPLVNKWSGFGPWEYYNVSGVLTTRIVPPYSLGIFAGYHHGAIVPYMQPVSAIVLDSSYNAVAYNATIKINLGELNWSKFGYDYCYILVDGVVNSSFALTAYTGNTLKDVVIALTTPVQGYDRNYAVTIWMGNDIQKTSNLTQVSGVFNITVQRLPEFTSHTVVNSAANKSAIEGYVGIDVAFEYISNIYLQTFNLAISSNTLTGKYLLTADVKRKSDNVLLRTITVGGGGAIDRPLCNVNLYKTNNNVTSATSTIDTNYQIGTAAGGYAYVFTIPTILNKADGDNFYLVFDTFH